MSLLVNAVRRLSHDRVAMGGQNTVRQIYPTAHPLICVRINRSSGASSPAYIRKITRYFVWSPMTRGRINRAAAVTSPAYNYAKAHRIPYPNRSACNVCCAPYISLCADFSSLSCRATPPSRSCSSSTATCSACASNRCATTSTASTRCSSAWRSPPLPTWASKRWPRRSPAMCRSFSSRRALWLLLFSPARNLDVFFLYFSLSSSISPSLSRYIFYILLT